MTRSAYNDFQTRLKAEAPDLAAALERVEVFLTQWWQDNRMPHFTDHGPSHSRRVVELAFQLFPQSFRPDAAPSVLELFVLAAATLLHDIGMQSLPPTHPLGQVTDADYVFVRKEHPAKSQQLIIEQATRIGLPDDPQLIAAIALVAQ